LTDPILFFWLVLKASLLSSGGQGNLPSLHQDFISREWATEGQFAASLAVGQVAPGPGGFWVVAIGYLVAGLPGAAMAAVAVVLPPFLVIPVGRLHRRFAANVAVQGFVSGIVLVVAATVPVVFLRILAAYGLDFRTLLIVMGCLAAHLSRRFPVIAVIGIGAVAGLVLFH
jgi:chromate transporter